MTLRKVGNCKECGAILYGDDYGPAGHRCSKVKEIDWKTEYEKELKHWREIATVLSDCIFMLDASEAFECEFDGDLYQKAIELAQMFRTKEEKKEE